MNFKKIILISFVLSVFIILFKLIVLINLMDLSYLERNYMLMILSIIQFLPLVPFLFVFYKRQT